MSSALNSIGPAQAAVQAERVAKVAEVKADAAPKVTAPKPSTVVFDPALAKKNLTEAVGLLNQQMAATGRGLGFSYDSLKNSPVVKVSDVNTGEVVRQIPSEDLLRIAHNIDDLKGILFNKIT